MSGSVLDEKRVRIIERLARLSPEEQDLVLNPLESIIGACVFAIAPGGTKGG